MNCYKCTRCLFPSYDGFKIFPSVEILIIKFHISLLSWFTFHFLIALLSLLDKLANSLLSKETCFKQCAISVSDIFLDFPAAAPVVLGRKKCNEMSEFKKHLSLLESFFFFVLVNIRFLDAKPKTFVMPE